MVNTVLQVETFKQLRDFIYEKCGIYVPDTKKYLLEKRLLQRVQECNLGGFDEYLPFLRFSANRDELVKFFDAVTTNETYFFREPNQLEVFIELIVPQILGQKSSKDIRIWSAACSTGEEPYTLAILLKEKQPGLRAELIASDISNSVLESARKAAYGSYSTRNVPPPYLAKYFMQSGWVHELDNGLKNAVKFMNINLIDEQKVKAVQGVDAIFCRNVLIYFDDKSKQKAVSLLYDSLRPGGFLIISLSESLHSVTRAFKPVIFNKIVAYQKV